MLNLVTGCGLPRHHKCCHFVRPVEKLNETNVNLAAIRPSLFKPCDRFLACGFTLFTRLLLSSSLPLHFTVFQVGSNIFL